MLGCARFPHIIAPVSPNMVLQREKHTVIKPFTTNYDETHPRMVDSLYSLHFITGFLPWFSTCFPHVFHVFHPISSQRTSEGSSVLASASTRGAFPLSTNSSQENQIESCEDCWRKDEKKVKKCGEKMWNGVTT